MVFKSPIVISFEAVGEEASALLPIIVWLVPLVVALPAPPPIKVLSPPVAFPPALFPTATLPELVVAASNAFLPIATLLSPLDIAIPALDPIKVLLADPPVKAAPASAPNTTLLLPSG